MTEQEKPKITISFTERKRNLGLNQLKKLGRFYLVVVIAIAIPEAILDFTGIVPFGFPEALIDFFCPGLVFCCTGVFHSACHHAYTNIQEKITGYFESGNFTRINTDYSSHNILSDLSWTWRANLFRSIPYF